MDYGLAKRLMEEGKLPNFSRLAAMGSFIPLETSAPPLSPVAWSTFITGMDSGGHGIYDFIHRHPETMIPYLSTSETEPSKKPISLGSCEFPTGGGETVNMRQGTPFWEVLEENGVETSILRIPANFPPTGTATREISGMGTPDILGTYGTYSFYTSVLFPFPGQDIGSGNVYEAWEEDGVVRSKLYGPKGLFAKDPDEVSTEFEVYIDPEQPVAKLVVGDEERVLQEGEWSDWVPVSFELDQCLGSPFPSLPAMARFYLRSVRPEFEMYVSPLNFDPMDPATPISTPDDYAAELAAASGRFYSQGMPEETKGLSEGVLTVDEFLVQSEIAGQELAEQYRHVLGDFEDGLLFYYFGNLDLVSHMMWRATDPGHPAYNAETDAPYAEVIEGLYRNADEIIGYTLENKGEDTTLIVMSDHGFASWRRSFHSNTWLRDNGYLGVKNPDLARDPGLYINVDWSKTQAYGLGLNGLYINVAGREKNGIVDPSKRSALAREIAAKLLKVVDPVTGEPAITNVYLRDDLQYTAEQEIGPDIVIGYAKGTRGSNESALGEVPSEQFQDNTEAWSGDHGMDHRAVPGILFTDRPLKKPATSLQNLAASILAEFGVEGFPAPPQAAGN
jgi:predicted AlkP superfamily phosphohydrolase/phosphomutase